MIRLSPEGIHQERVTCEGCGKTQWETLGRFDGLCLRCQGALASREHQRLAELALAAEGES